ncbi:MAG: hypothetical protein LBQ15_03455 [Clostridium sp.]|jgi:hypothetical protein|nr:hypothetical protein [Clostridium sp.]
MKKLSKILALLLAPAMVLSACSSGQTGGGSEKPHYVIGVIPFNDTAAEQIEWNSYLKDYVGPALNIDFKFAVTPTDASHAVTIVEELSLAGAQGILSVVDYPSAVQKAEELGLWYIRSGGLSTMTEYDQVKDIPHYLGTMGPSLDEEYTAGYEMVKYYIDAGKKDFLVFAAILGIYLPSDMHVRRFEGMRDAFLEAGAEYTAPASGSVIEGPGVGEFATGTSGLNISVVYGYPLESLDATFHDRFTQAVSGKTFDAVPMAAEGSQNMNTWLNGAGITGAVMGEVGAFTPTAKELFESGVLNYLVGKYASSMGPAVVALINAIDGHADVVRNEDGTGSRLNAPFWTASSLEDFQEKQEFDSVTDPAFNEAVMSKYIVRLHSDVTREDFAKFASFGYDDLKALR